MEIRKEDFNLANSTTKLLYGIYESLERINDKLDKLIPAEEKPKKKKGVEK